MSMYYICIIDGDDTYIPKHDTIKIINKLLFIFLLSMAPIYI
jgi:hypothetical protein